MNLIEIMYHVSIKLSGNTSGRLGEQWENKKCCGNNEPTCKRFHSFYEFSKTSTSVLLTQRNTESICSTGISFRKEHNENRTACILWSSTCNFFLLAPSQCQQLVHVLVQCFYWVIKTSVWTNQQCTYYHWDVF